MRIPLIPGLIPGGPVPERILCTQLRTVPSSNLNANLTAGVLQTPAGKPSGEGRCGSCSELCARNSFFEQMTSPPGNNPGTECSWTL
jgi:hypothetical protein